MTVFREIIQDLLSPRVVPALLQGVILAVLLVVLEVSFASIIFDAHLSPFTMTAAGLTLFGAVVMNLVVGLRSSFKGMTCIPQDTPAAILAGSVGALVGSMALAPAGEQFVTAVALLALTALVTAACFGLIGRFRLSNLARYMPYPVAGGFLAGTGALLAKGGLGVMTGIPLGVDTLSAYLAPDAIFRWLPGVVYAGVTFALLKRWAHYLILPLSFVLALGLFLICFALSGATMAQAQASGWFPEGLPGGGIWPAVCPRDLLSVHWSPLISRIPDILTVTFISLIGMLFNVSGIELGANQEIDLDHELKVSAAANALAGAGGSYAGYNVLSLSLLGVKTGLSSRLVALFGAGICACVLFLGAGILAWFPKPLLGGMVFLIGLFFLDDWLVASLRKFTPVDYGILLSILGFILVLGFLEGIGLGLILTVIIFIFRFSRVPVIASEQTGADVRSRRERPIPDRALLRENGPLVWIYRLTGYLFFGSASRVAGTISVRLQKGTPLPGYVILDLSAVSGYDISAVNTFQRIAQQAAARGISLLFTAVPDTFFGLLERNCAPETLASVHRFQDADSGLQWCEDRILAEEHARLHSEDSEGTQRKDALLHLVADELDAHLQEMENVEALVEALESYGESVKFPAGTDILEQGQEVEGLFLILWGSASEYKRDSEGREKRMRSLGPGNVIAPLAGLRRFQARTMARAETDVAAFFISRESTRRLEAESPETAVVLLKRLVEKTG
jgi:sulfate permease, SulP family